MAMRGLPTRNHAETITAPAQHAAAGFPMKLCLPYPPSINHYWRRAGRIIHISREGRDYRQKVVDLFDNDAPLTNRLAVRLTLFPPDRRRRDIDNVQKPLLDALQHAGAYEDDSQIDWLLTERGDVFSRPAIIRIASRPETGVFSCAERTATSKQGQRWFICDTSPATDTNPQTSPELVTVSLDSCSSSRNRLQRTGRADLCALAAAVGVLVPIENCLPNGRATQMAPIDN
jgi:crossover junction endodeoxyribonuclease RusA